MTDDDSAEHAAKRPKTAGFGSSSGFGGGFAAFRGTTSFGASSGTSFAKLAASGGGTFGASPAGFGFGVAPAPAPVVEAQKNGEESEKYLGRYRAKLFELGSETWRERGIGQLRVLEASDRATRAVMRREQTHSLMLNVKLAHTRVAKHGDTALRVACMTSANSAATYLIKVKVKDDRDALFDLFSAAAPPAPAAPAPGAAEPDDDDARDPAADDLVDPAADDAHDATDPAHDDPDDAPDPAVDDAADAPAA